LVKMKIQLTQPSWSWGLAELGKDKSSSFFTKCGDPCA
jgi:hypothetical protein